MVASSTTASSAATAATPTSSTASPAVTPITATSTATAMVAASPVRHVVMWMYVRMKLVVGPLELQCLEWRDNDRDIALALFRRGGQYCALRTVWARRLILDDYVQLLRCCQLGSGGAR